MKKSKSIRHLVIAVVFAIAVVSSYVGFALVQPPPPPPPGGQSHCEDRSGVANTGWCLPADNGGQYCGSGGCNCTCDGTYWDYTPGDPY
jgi:hypothetical protein